jgi:NAD(P)-dependent dehydrogenase (short-subunit alcohol dehydrogenase family)
MTHTLVVGGSRGIGLAVVRRSVADGDVVSIIARSEAEEASAPGATHWSIDLADAVALPAMIAEIVRANGPFRSIVLLQRFRGDGDAWHGELDVSLTATKTIVESAREAFTTQGGAIVIVCSNAGRFVADEQPVGYHAAKAALRQMARYYAVELGPSGIRVNCVTPGAVLKEGARGATAAAALGDVTPLRRIATADDIAASVAFLCSDAAACVTGQELVIDGGLSLLLQESLVQRLKAPSRAEP